VNLNVLHDFFLWCTVINFGILLLWFVAFAIARDGLQRIHGRWFRLTDAQFDTLHYAGISLFKIGIILFNLVPFIALTIVR
jgi:uncharacterized membrane protein